MNRRQLLWSVAALVLIGGVLTWSFPPALDVVPQPLFHDPDGRSDDLPADLKLMWETQPLTGNAGPHAGPDPRASSDRAIHAASRVFNTVDLEGRKRDEVVALLGDPRASSDSIYHFPFWPAPRNSLVYRFDCGAYGWQFNVVLSLRGRVSRVERHWIH